MGKVEYSRDKWGKSMRCPKCGANRVDGKRFCTSCGEDFFKEDSVVRIIDEEPIRYKSAEI